MRGFDGTSRNNKRPCGVAEYFQVRKHRVERHSDDSRNILAKEPSGSEFFNNVAHFRPEVTVICRASLLPGNTERLARESGANKVNWCEVVLSALPDVPESGDSGPMLFEDFCCIIINLHLPFDRAKSGPLKPKFQATNTGKEATDC